MASKTKNPAPLAKATGLGNVAHSHALNARVLTPSLAVVQTNFVARRSRLSPIVARVVAELFFAGAGR